MTFFHQGIGYMGNTFILHFTNVVHDYRFLRIEPHFPFSMAKRMRITVENPNVNWNLHAIHLLKFSAWAKVAGGTYVCCFESLTSIFWPLWNSAQHRKLQLKWRDRTLGYWLCKYMSCPAMSEGWTRRMMIPFKAQLWNIIHSLDNFRSTSRLAQRSIADRLMHMTTLKSSVIPVSWWYNLKVSRAAMRWCSFTDHLITWCT